MASDRRFSDAKIYYRIRVLDWLDGHIARMNPENVPLSDNENDERQRRVVCNSVYCR